MSKEELLFCPLGGSGEIGMNLNLYAYGKENDQKWIAVDMGVTFADDSIPGIDLIYPDTGFLVEKKKDLLIDVEHLHVENLLHHLTQCKSRYHNPDELKKQYNDFKTFYTQYDERRGFDFRSTFDPMMVEWFDSLETQQPITAELGTDPATLERYNAEKKYG